MRQHLALASALALLLGAAGVSSGPVLAQDPEGANQRVESGEETGFLTNVDPAGNSIEVDGVRYLVDEGIDLGDLSEGRRVTVRFEPSDLGTVPLATDIMGAEG
jgi:hypothetical protein